MYDFSTSPKKVKLTPSRGVDRKKLLLVVGREHYFESTRDYPIGHLRDLKSLLKNASWSFPYDGVLFNKIERLNEQSHRVTSWVIDKKILDGLGFSPIWIIPESACLECFAGESLVELDRLGKKIFVLATKDGLRSSLGNEEAFLQANVPNSKARKFIAGDGNRFDDHAAAEMLLLGIGRTFSQWVQLFFYGLRSKSLSSLSPILGLKLSAVACLCYLMITSAALLAASSWVDYRLDVSTKSAGAAMSYRAKMNDLGKRLESLNLKVKDHYPFWVTWDVLIDLDGVGVTFRSINSSANDVTYYLTAPKATDILSWLSKDARIASAEFSIPVRQSPAGEEFAVKVTFSKQESAMTENFVYER